MGFDPAAEARSKRPPPRARFVRTPPDKRRQDLIDATARCLAERGVAGASVREICKRAGVSAGLLTHYFAGVDALIVATYRDVVTRVAGILTAAADAAGSDPRTRLLVYVAASFRDPVADPDLLATWIAFWSLVRSHPGVAHAHRELYAEGRAEIAALVAACLPRLDAATLRLMAIAISGTMDGLWLELCLDPGTFTPAEAERIAIMSVGRLLDNPIGTEPHDLV